jgi:hypothetical protein
MYGAYIKKTRKFIFLTRKTNAETNLPGLNPDLTTIFLLGAVAKVRKATINFVVSVSKVQPSR